MQLLIFWEYEMKKKSQNSGTEVNAEGDVTIGGDVVGRDKITNTVNNYYLSLEFLSKFLQQIRSDQTPAELLAGSSRETAKDRALHLYKTLGLVNQKTDAFVEAFGRLVALLANATTQEDLHIGRNTLTGAAHELIYALPALAAALDDVNPQLDIHKHELVQRIEQYSQSRSQVLTELENSAATTADQSLEILKPILDVTEKNRLLIRQAIMELREFLAKEFPFKESF